MQTEGSLHRIVSGFAVGALGLSMLALLDVAQAASPAQAQPAPQSRLAFRYSNLAQSVSRSRYPIIILAHAKSGTQIPLERRKGMQYLDVTPGTYYLLRVQGDRFGFASDAMPKPEDPGRLLEVPAGSITYIGDLKWSSQTGLRLGFSKHSLLSMQGNKTLHASPLFLSGFGKKPQSVSWN